MAQTLKYAYLAAVLDGLPEFGEILSAKGAVSVTGVSDTAAAHLVFCYAQKSERVLVVAADGINARALHKDLSLLFEGGDTEVLYFPEKELFFYDIEAADRDALIKRLSVLKRLTTAQRAVVVTTVGAMLTQTPPPDELAKMRRVIKSGDTIELEELAQTFVDYGYRREELVEGMGQFAIRGSIVDFSPESESVGYRIDFFDDEVDSIRAFDPVTQRTTDMLPQCEITPVEEILLTKERRTRLCNALDRLINLCDKQGKAAVSQSLSADLERVAESRSFRAIDRYIPILFDPLPTLLDYFEGAPVFLHEPERLQNAAESISFKHNNALEAITDRFIPDISGHWLLPFDSLMTRLLSHKIIGLFGLPQTHTLYTPNALVSLTVKQQLTTHGKMAFIYDALKQYIAKGYTITILAGGEQTAHNLLSLCAAEEIPAEYHENLPTELKPKTANIVTGILQYGFEYPTLKAVVITDQTLFGYYHKAPKTGKRRGEAIHSYQDLTPGDYVVHQNHGIAQFTGITTMSKEGAKQDYLKLQFAGNSAIYLPVSQLDMLYRYTGAKESLKLNKLNGTEWQKTKAKVKKACADMAEELIKLYASRAGNVGVAFSPDNDWQRQFEDMFAFDETEDQLRCINEVKSDMEKPMPMDRLLCGDVGFGKTEVAMRAAFKAASDGYQVAYLVPTTILATQHFNTFFERNTHFGLKVDVLSRFRTPKQQKDTLHQVRRGEIDIVIGTHRLLQKDVHFKNLGLLIIDEEQRFGVAHKEAIKQLKQDVDVLTLTATPIPRTLHMSLVGIRDMSVIDNPPRNRYPVATFVCEYNTEIIRDAILSEIARGGQVYYLHNRVQTIEKTAALIRSFSPTLRVAIGHGQMSERQLEDCFINVLNGNIDVLVCTTIIETGLDIPNINTIIIEDADKMGLAQLYQLRGRVGRAGSLAYAYLTYKRDKVMTEVAEKRLRAIREFTEFGSGFKIALRDLEIRGAGNLVGAQQHGHMDAVGYDMYCSLLNEAVSELKGQPVAKKTSASISLEADAYIHKRYIRDEGLRIEMYKRIATVQTKEDAMDLYDELCDRFGEPPECVQNLIEIVRIKHIAEKLGIEDISQARIPGNDKGAVITFVFIEGADIDPARMMSVWENHKGRVKLVPGNKPKVALTLQRTDTLLDDVREFLGELSEEPAIT